MSPARDDPFSAPLATADPAVDLLVRFEDERQARKLILIPSESLCPRPVRQALATSFTNLYAEGWPRTKMLDAGDLMGDWEQWEAEHRRYGDRRYYRGCDFVNFVEALAQQRAAEVFAGNGVEPGDIHASVQPLSGAAANNAVYEALLKPGDRVMGLELAHGGHLTHGSPYNRSGKYYEFHSYGVSPETGRLDYAAIHRLAEEVQPQMIVAGASAYPWDLNWAALRAICDAVASRPKLLADIAHPAGLVAAGLFPNPIGHAHIVTFTTHKTLLGPRGAIALSTDESIGRAVERAVFPGEQGGPHVNNIAGIAVCLALAQTEAFRRVQQNIVLNSAALADALKARGLTLAYGGTNTHLLLVDLKALPSVEGVPATGEVASRILDLCGLVCNKNTLPGDTRAGAPSGLRFGTPWVTQRGAMPEQMERIAEAISVILHNLKPFSYEGLTSTLWRTKVEFGALREARSIVDDVRSSLVNATPSPSLPGARGRGEELPPTHAVEVSGARAALFLQAALPCDVLGLKPRGAVRTPVFGVRGEALGHVTVQRMADDGGTPRFHVDPDPDGASTIRDWLQALSDGYVVFDRDDLHRKVDGPVVLHSAPPSRRRSAAGDAAPLRTKPYFVGQAHLTEHPPTALTSYRWSPPTYPEPRRTCLTGAHEQVAGARFFDFAHWWMPLQFTDIAAEHRAVRSAAGLFDVTHMGTMEFLGPAAERFLDLVTTNYVPGLKPGQAHYSYVLDPGGSVIDDVIVYRLAREHFLMVTNAVNHERVRDWFRAVAGRKHAIDPARLWVTVDAIPEMRDLKAADAGEHALVDIAFQGKQALPVLQDLADAELRQRLPRLRKFGLTPGRIANVPVVVARTGYTGEDWGFELLLHPDTAPAVWNAILASGESRGVTQCGLGARDSCRIEAGFPLHGSELAGPDDLMPSEAGYGGFVKLHKAFFVGRQAVRERLRGERRRIIRFRLQRRGVRMVRLGNAVVLNGEPIGAVTSSTNVDGLQMGLALVTGRTPPPGTVVQIAYGAADKQDALVLPRFWHPAEAEELPAAGA